MYFRAVDLISLEVAVVFYIRDIRNETRVRPTVQSMEVIVPLPFFTLVIPSSRCAAYRAP